MVLHRAKHRDDGPSAWDVGDLPLRIIYAPGARCWQITPSNSDAWYWLAFSDLEHADFPTREAARRAVDAELSVRPLKPVQLGRGGRSADEHWMIERREHGGRLEWAVIPRSEIAKRLFNAEGGRVCRWARTEHQAYRTAMRLSVELP